MHFDLNKTFDSPLPTVTVDGDLPIGVHRFQLVVEDATGQPSAPAFIDVLVLEALPPTPTGPVIVGPPTNPTGPVIVGPRPVPSVPTRPVIVGPAPTGPNIAATPRAKRPPQTPKRRAKRKKNP